MDYETEIQSDMCALAWKIYEKNAGQQSISALYSKCLPIAAALHAKGSETPTYLLARNQ